MKLFGLLGYPLSHSFSKTYFANKFKELNLSDYNYENFEVEDLSGIKAHLNSRPGLCGFNVTIPYKESILQYLDSLIDLVQDIHACNCIKLSNGTWIGYNTDVVGFEMSFRKNLKPHHKQALILGTGGASKAVSYVCRKLGLAVTYVSINRKGNGYLSYNDVDAHIILQHQVIINTTPLGSFPDMHAFPDIPYQFITPEHYLFDVIYNPGKTVFLSKGEAQGAQIVNGYEMLVTQAEESWKIWND